MSVTSRTNDTIALPVHQKEETNSPPKHSLDIQCQRVKMTTLDRIVLGYAQKVYRRQNPHQLNLNRPINVAE